MKDRAQGTLNFNATIRNVRIRNRTYAAFCTAALLSTCVAAVYQMTSLGGSSGVDLTWVALATYFIMRAWSVGVTVHDDHIVIHGWVKNRTIERLEIQKIRISPYWGMLSTHYPDARLRMLVLIINGGEVEIPELPAFPEKSRKLYRELSTLLQFPYSDPSIPRHRRGTM